MGEHLYLTFRVEMYDKAQMMGSPEEASLLRKIHKSIVATLKQEGYEETEYFTHCWSE